MWINQMQITNISTNNEGGRIACVINSEICKVQMDGITLKIQNAIFTSPLVIGR